MWHFCIFLNGICLFKSFYSVLTFIHMLADKQLDSLGLSLYVNIQYISANNLKKKILLKFKFCRITEIFINLILDLQLNYIKKYKHFKIIIVYKYRFTEYRKILRSFTPKIL